MRRALTLALAACFSPLFPLMAQQSGPSQRRPNTFRIEVIPRANQLWMLSHRRLKLRRLTKPLATGLWTGTVNCPAFTAGESGGGGSDGDENSCPAQSATVHGDTKDICEASASIQCTITCALDADDQGTLPPPTAPVTCTCSAFQDSNGQCCDQSSVVNGACPTTQCTSCGTGMCLDQNGSCCASGSYNSVLKVCTSATSSNSSNNSNNSNSSNNSTGGGGTGSSTCTVGQSCFGAGAAAACAAAGGTLNSATGTCDAPAAANTCPSGTVPSGLIAAGDYVTRPASLRPQGFVGTCVAIAIAGAAGTYAIFQYTGNSGTIAIPRHCGGASSSLYCPGDGAINCDNPANAGAVGCGASPSPPATTPLTTTQIAMNDLKSICSDKANAPSGCAACLDNFNGSCYALLKAQYATNLSNAQLNQQVGNEVQFARDHPDTVTTDGDTFNGHNAQNPCQNFNPPKSCQNTPQAAAGQDQSPPSPQAGGATPGEGITGRMHRGPSAAAMACFGKACMSPGTFTTQVPDDPSYNNNYIAQTAAFIPAGSDAQGQPIEGAGVQGMGPNAFSAVGPDGFLNIPSGGGVFQGPPDTPPKPNSVGGGGSSGSGGSSNTTQCPSPQQLINGTCQTPNYCPTGTTPDSSGRCVATGGGGTGGTKCSGGQVSVNGTCQCPSGQILVSGTCQSQTTTLTCSGGQVAVNGACQCPSGQTLVGGTCKSQTALSCSGGQVVVNGACQCPSGQTLVSGTCQAPVNNGNPYGGGGYGTPSPPGGSTGGGNGTGGQQNGGNAPPPPTCSPSHHGWWFSFRTNLWYHTQGACMAASNDDSTLCSECP